MSLRLTSNSTLPPQLPSSWNYRRAPPRLFCLYESTSLRAPALPDWHIPLTIPIPQCPSILLHTPECPSLSTLSNIPLQKHATHTLLIHPSADGYVEWLFFLCGANNSTMNMSVSKFFHVSTRKFFGQYPEVKWLCYINLLKLYFCIAKLV